MVGCRLILHSTRKIRPAPCNHFKIWLQTLFETEPTRIQYQTNKASNQSQARVTPKSRVFHESMAFQYQNANVIGIHNWGYNRWWHEVYSSTGISCSGSFSLHLDRVKRKKRRVKENSEKLEVKQRRAHKQDAVEKTLLYENQTAEYGSGIGLDIGAPATRTTRKKRAKCTECPRCKRKTHLWSNSRECPYNNKKLGCCCC